MVTWNNGLLDRSGKDIGTNGNDVAVFRNVIASRYNVPENRVFLSNSGTSALELALQQSYIHGNTQVVLSDMSFVGLRNVIVKSGSWFEVHDINLHNCIMKFDDRLYDKCKRLSSRGYHVVLMPTLLYGAPLGFDFNNFDFEYVDAVIVDACEGYLTGLPFFPYLNSINDFKLYLCFSFNNNKILTTGGGGAIIGDEDDIKTITDRNKQSYYPYVGENKGMPALNAKEGWKRHYYRLESDIIKKLKIFYHYMENINTFKVSMQYMKGGNYWYSFAIFENKDLRNDVVDSFIMNRIPFRKPFPPINGEPNTKSIYERGLCLPCSVDLTTAHLHEVCNIINNV